MRQLELGMWLAVLHSKHYHGDDFWQFVSKLVCQCHAENRYGASLFAVSKCCLATRVWGWRYCLGVVALWRPLPCFWSTAHTPYTFWLHVSPRLSSFLIWRYVQPSSLIWTTLATSISDKCLQTHEHMPIKNKNISRISLFDIIVTGTNVTDKCDSPHRHSLGWVELRIR